MENLGEAEDDDEEHLENRRRSRSTAGNLARPELRALPDRRDVLADAGSDPPQDDDAQDDNVDRFEIRHRSRSTGGNLARPELRARPVRREVLADAGLPPSLSNDSIDAEDAEDTARRETRTKCANEVAFNHIFGGGSDYDVQPGQERIPKDQDTSESSDDGEDGNEETEEDSDSAAGDDNVTLNIGDDVVSHQSERYTSHIKRGVWCTNEDIAHGNLEVNFYDFTDEPDSPKPPRKMIDSFLEDPRSRMSLRRRE